MVFKAFICYNKKEVGIMKKLFLLLLIICLLSGCHSAPKEENYDTTPPQYTTGNKQPSEENNALQPQQINKKYVVDGVTYQSVSDIYGYNFEITRDDQPILDYTDFINNQLNDWQVCDDNILALVNMRLFCYSLADGTLEPILTNEVVSAFDYYNGYIYYIEHANRTFSVYRTKFGSDKKELVLGHDVYDKENPKELISNFVITDDGDIVFTQRVPYGLYVYKNGKTKLILESSDINELSLCCHKNDVYFVIEKTLYVYTQGKINQLFDLEDYKNFLFVQDGQCSYLSTDKKLIKKSLG